MGSCVQPGEALSQKFYVELFVFQVDSVEVGDLVLAAGGGFEVLGVLDDAAVVEIQSGHAVVALGMLGFFLDGNGISVFVKLNNAEALGVIDIVAEDSGALAVFRLLHGGAESLPESVAGKDIVAQDHGGGFSVNELFTEGKGLREAVRRGLGLVREMDSELVAVSQEDLKAGQILRRGDDQNIADPGVHQDGNRIVDHRFVIDREQLLGCDHSQRIESGAGAAGENDAFH